MYYGLTTYTYTHTHGRGWPSSPPPSGRGPLTPPFARFTRTEVNALSTYRRRRRRCPVKHFVCPPCVYYNAIICIVMIKLFFVSDDNDDDNSGATPTAKGSFDAQNRISTYVYSHLAPHISCSYHSPQNSSKLV